jgi:hypothetical protein
MTTELANEVCLRSLCADYPKQAAAQRANRPDWQASPALHVSGQRPTDAGLGMDDEEPSPLADYRRPLARSGSAWVSPL